LPPRPLSAIGAPFPKDSILDPVGAVRRPRILFPLHGGTSPAVLQARTTATPRRPPLFRRFLLGGQPLLIGTVRVKVTASHGHRLRAFALAPPTPEPIY
jgi:hypothetical protein